MTLGMLWVCVIAVVIYGEGGDKLDEDADEDGDGFFQVQSIG